jgi:hypothetical protein
LEVEVGAEAREETREEESSRVRRDRGKNSGGNRRIR